jgi:hypothetical protein
MKKETGDRECEIWLLGDSNPKNWESVLDSPMDPRHPSRHNIWTPVLDVVQDTVFRSCRERVDTGPLYIRNAVENRDDKPGPNLVEWGPPVTHEIDDLHQALRQHRPSILLSFGAFSFEFARRSLGEEPSRHYSHWNTKRLGEEFGARIRRFDPDRTNLLPLLHATIARGRFIQAHEHFCEQEGADYFQFVGSHIAQKLLQHYDQLHVWMQ